MQKNMKNFFVQMTVFFCLYIHICTDICHRISLPPLIFAQMCIYQKLIIDTAHIYIRIKTLMHFYFPFSVIY